jgi:DNA replication licensing factor MCM7
MDRQFAHTSPRTLLGVLRLAQALARLRLSDTVVMEDVDEALRLIEVSKASLYDTDQNVGADMTTSSKIFRIIRTAAGRGNEVPMRIIRERVLAKGYTEDALVKCVEEYEGLDVWQVSENGTKLVFIGADDDEDDEDVEMAE